MVKKIIGVLRGMKAIADFVGFSPATVLKLQKNYPGMPISKVNGEWLGNLDDLEQFMKDLAAGKTEKWLEPPTTKGKEDHPEKKDEGEPLAEGSNGATGKKVKEA